MADRRKQTKNLVKQVRERDLVFEFFFVFSRFEYALLKTKYVLQRRDAVFADRDRFAKEHDKAFNPDSKELQEAVVYYETYPPKKQVVDDSGWLTVKDAPPQGNERLTVEAVDFGKEGSK